MGDFLDSMLLLMKFCAPLTLDVISLCSPPQPPPPTLAFPRSTNIRKNVAWLCRSCMAVGIFFVLDGTLKEDWNRCLNLVQCFQYLLPRWPTLTAIVIEKIKQGHLGKIDFIAFILKILEEFPPFFFHLFYLAWKLGK